MKSMKVLFTVAGVSVMGFGCGAQVKNASDAANLAQNEKKLSERIQFAKASADVDAIELALGIEGTKTVPAPGTDAIDAETPDVVSFQVGKDGKLEATPVAGMDIRGEGQCLEGSCKTATVALHVNESGFSTDEARLEITANRTATCKVKSLATTQDDLGLALADSLKGKLLLSVVEKLDGPAKYVSISKVGADGTSPFLRANLEPSSRLQLDLVKKDGAGNITRSAIEQATIASATLGKAPFSLTMQLNYKDQPSAEIACKF